jgi:hypothetical protein
MTGWRLTYGNLLGFGLMIFKVQVMDGELKSLKEVLQTGIDAIEGNYQGGEQNIALDRNCSQPDVEAAKKNIHGRHTQLTSAYRWR